MGKLKSCQERQARVQKLIEEHMPSFDMYKQSKKAKVDIDFNKVEKGTRIKLVEKDNKAVEINPHDLSKQIKENKKIKEVIIETMSPDNISRAKVAIDNKDEIKTKNLEVEHLKYAEFLLNDIPIVENKKNDLVLVEDKVKAIEKVEVKEAESKIIEVSKDEVKSEQTEVHAERFVLKRKEFSREHYYKAKNHHELFQLGSAYLKDYKVGKRNFAFAGMQCKREVENTIYGLISFFNYHAQVRPTIITANVNSPAYENYIFKSDMNRWSFKVQNLSLIAYECAQCTIFDISSIQRILKEDSNSHIEQFLDELYLKSELVVWDFASFLDFKNDNSYFPILSRLDHISLILKKSESKLTETVEIIDYLKKYSIPLKGVIMAKGK